MSAGASPLAVGPADCLETGRTLRDNGSHPVEERPRFTPRGVSGRVAMFRRSVEIRAPWRAVGGRS